MPLHAGSRSAWTIRALTFSRLAPPKSGGPSRAKTTCEAFEETRRRDAHILYPPRRRSFFARQETRRPARRWGERQRDTMASHRGARSSMSNDNERDESGSDGEVVETVGEVAKGAAELGETISKAAEGDVAGALGSGLGALGSAGELAGGALGDTESDARDAVNTASTVANTASSVVNAGRSLAGAAQSGDVGRAAGALGSAGDAARYIVPAGEAREALEGVGSAAGAVQQGAEALDRAGGTSGGGAGRNPVTFLLEVAGLDGQWGVISVSLQESLNSIPSAQIRARYDGHPERSDLLLAEAKLTVERGEQLREFKGLVFHARIQEGDEDSEVTFQLAPAATYLAHKVNNRIHQNLTVVEAIIETYKGMLGPLQRSVDESNLQRTYEKREYNVQYQESNLSFLSRLAEEEGIFWFFDYEGDKEVLVLADAVAGLAQARANDGGEAPYHPDSRQAPDGESVTQVNRDEVIGATDVVVRGWDWTNPALDVVAEQTGRGDAEPATEIYDHTDALIVHDYRDEQYKGNTARIQAQLRAERLDLDRKHWSMNANVVSAHPGRTLGVVGSPGDFDARYLIVSMTSHGSATEGVSGTWTSSMDVVPTAVPYRPPHRTPRPIAHGPETAIVVGPGGSEIHTDEHGRVKVRFHWDRDHAPRENDSSCWIRVSHNWAGPGFGTFFLPRVDMEVVVSFLGGNPDRPIVTGCVYHGTNRVGVELDAKKTQSLIRTKSSPNSEGFNEMRFEDEAGNEFIYVHAEKDYTEEVEHDHSTHVKNCQTNTVDVDQTETVGHDQTMHVKNDRKKTVDKFETTTIGEDRDETVHGAETVTIDKTRDHTVKKDESLLVTEGHRSVTVMTGEDKETYKGGRATTVDKHDNLHVIGGNNRNETITGQRNQWVTKKYTLVQADTEKFILDGNGYWESAQMIRVITGSSTLQMKAGGDIAINASSSVSVEVGSSKFEIKPGKISIEADEIQLKAGESALKLEASKATLKGAMVDLLADMFATIKGTLVRLN
ncbi:MAG: type VI secretion system tip protein TssI/VgrG [Sandaracinaceae bacterium]